MVTQTQEKRTIFGQQNDLGDLAVVWKEKARTPSILLTIAVALLVHGRASDALTVSGTVKDQDGVAAVGAVVTFIDESNESQRISTVTDNAGGYEADLSHIGPVPTLVSVSEASGKPSEFRLFQNYPNPFNPETIIPYQIPKSSYVSVTIYSSLGQRIRTLVHEHQTPGVYEVRWDATDNTGRGVSAGVYFYQLRAEGFVQTGKMLLLDGNKAAVAANFISSDPFRNPAAKRLVLPSLVTLMVTGEGFFDYVRTGVALTGDTVIDILVNSTVDKGMLRLSLTDAPVDSADAVRVTISSVQIRREQGDPWETFAGEETFDLLALSGISTLLGEQVLAAGPVTGVRLIVDHAEIDIDGGTFPLFILSGSETGLTLEGDFEIVSGDVIDLTLDFDARKSVVSGERADDFLLQPVVRLMSTAEAGSIPGRVVLGEGVFLEEIDVVVIARQAGDEISSARVDPVDGTYRIAFLPAGTYDLTAEGVGLIIEPQSIVGISVTAGEETENVDFTITGDEAGRTTDTAPALASLRTEILSVLDDWIESRYLPEQNVEPGDIRHGQFLKTDNIRMQECTQLIAWAYMQPDSKHYRSTNVLDSAVWSVDHMVRAQGSNGGFNEYHGWSGVPNRTLGKSSVSGFTLYAIARTIVILSPLEEMKPKFLVKIDSDGVNGPDTPRRNAWSKMLEAAMEYHYSGFGRGHAPNQDLGALAAVYAMNEAWTMLAPDAPPLKTANEVEALRDEILYGSPLYARNSSYRPLYKWFSKTRLLAEPGKGFMGYDANYGEVSLAYLTLCARRDPEAAKFCQEYSETLQYFYIPDNEAPMGVWMESAISRRVGGERRTPYGMWSLGLASSYHPAMDRLYGLAFEAFADSVAERMKLPSPPRFSNSLLPVY